ncbi:SDR family oxidoreductase [Nannocystis sp.]|uniref:SDR family NAD(P)-dependent oxidoreductase n=1 Tax=Nannocystis sp. TaxID=1962667 RepID=UPI002425A484|nr:SDR family oxidoreductase [Nannocystis sp.]MBK7825844.1 SDR family oxidoreductase [Nannocystis sp.]MBK9755617.1 SDR family oxidoreductase [Nannocystis sp.]
MSANHFIVAHFIVPGRTALITGASRGLGRALALSLAARGVRLVLVARGQADLDAVVAEVRARGGEAHGIVADLADKRAIYPLAGQAAALVGPIDLLIHNASTLGPTPLRLLLDSECEDLEQVLAVNLVGPFRLSKIVAGAMALRGEGVIVHISSDAAIEAYPRWGAYSVAKAGQDHLSRIFAAELADTGVRVLAVDPGEMNTAMHAAAIPEADPDTLADPALAAARIVAMIDDPARAPTGSRLTATSWELS